MGKYTLKRVSYSDNHTPSVVLSNPKTYTLKTDTKGFSMTTSKIEVSSNSPKTFKIERKTKNFAGVVGSVVNGIGEGVKGAVNTVKEVGGGVTENIGKGMDSFVGKNVVGAVGGGLLGTMAGLGSTLALGPLGLLATPIAGAIGGLAGRTVMSVGGKALKGIGGGLKNSVSY